MYMYRRNSVLNVVTVVCMYNNCFYFNRLSAGRPVSGSTDTLGHSNESFIRLLGLYFDQKRDVPPSNEPKNVPTIGNSHSG